MKKILAVAVLGCLTSTIAVKTAGAVNIFDEFKNSATKQLMEPFAKDLGGLLGGADFHSGRAIGFPGFDVGVVAVGQFKPNADNLILKNAGVKAFGLPLVSAQVGLPFNIDVGVRGLPVQGATVVGAGLRYGVLKHTLAKFMPDLAVSAYYDILSHDVLKAKHLSFSACASFDIPFIKLFIGAGMDKTTLETKIALPDGTSSGDSVSVSGTRLTAGVNITPFPFTYVFGAYSILHGEGGAQAGLGVKF